jgi:mono/diheme cytochrome c family protein
MDRRSLGMSFCLLFTAVGLAACGGEAAEEAPPPAPATAPAAPPAAPGGNTMAEQGEALFASSGCVACHGPEAQGTPLAPNLTDATWLNITGPETGLQEKVAAVIRTGVATPKDPTHPAPMPPMGGATLSDEQVNQLAAYVASMH